MDSTSWFVAILVLLVVGLLGFVSGLALGVRRHQQQRHREDRQEREARRSW